MVWIVAPEFIRPTCSLLDAVWQILKAFNEVIRKI